VNDVSGGKYDSDMLPLIAKLRVPYIAMHMRGDPSDMQHPRHSTYVDTLSEVQIELQERLHEMDRFIPRWLQIVDPGIGFAKGYSENTEILKPTNLRTFKQALNDRPLLVGLSRKRFLSKIDEETRMKRNNLVTDFDNNINNSCLNDVKYNTSVNLNLEDRDALTAGANCAAILGGADILRVHNVKQTRLVVDTFSSLQI
jgi:2-amino-4-hydroxy-6-hydroxymethyldihydropteridine diphosphokinase / dihydropteroate synthase